MEDLKRQIDELEQENEALKQDKRNLERKVNELETEKEDLESEKEDLETENKELTEQLKEARAVVVNKDLRWGEIGVRVQVNDGSVCSTVAEREQVDVFNADLELTDEEEQEINNLYLDFKNEIEGKLWDYYWCDNDNFVDLKNDLYTAVGQVYEKALKRISAESEEENEKENEEDDA